ncbi:MAG: ABC transporter permease [Actinobacteria bacterium]|nr:ABC transporter permease [Actinomycetota bacterium]
MGTALLIARHDLRRRLRDRTAIVTAFIAPLVMASIVGFAFGRTSGAGFLRVAIADEDRTAASAGAIDNVIASAGLGKVFVLARVPDEATARAQFRSGAAGSAVVVHRGFSGLFNGQAQGTPVLVEAITSDHRTYAQQVAQSVVRALYGVVSSNALAVRTAYTTVTVTPAQVEAVGAAARAQPPPMRIVDDGIQPRKSLLGYFGPAMAIVFLFLGIGAGARSLLGERDTGTLARLKAAPIGMGRVVAGKVGAVLALAMLSIVVVWVATTVAFGAYWGPALAVLALCAATVLAFGGIALLLTVSSKTPAQSDATMAIVAFVLALLGGNFFPPGSLPPLLQRLALATPNGWALQGFGNVALDQGGFRDIVPALVVLLLIGAAVGGVALTRLRSLVEMT